MTRGERLTYRRPGEIQEYSSEAGPRDLIRRLAEYENTGLSPDEI